MYVIICIICALYAIIFAISVKLTPIIINNDDGSIEWRINQRTATLLFQPFPQGGGGVSVALIKAKAGT